MGWVEHAKVEYTGVCTLVYGDQQWQVALGCGDQLWQVALGCGGQLWQVALVVWRPDVAGGTGGSRWEKLLQ